LQHEGFEWEISRKKLSPAIRELIPEGWTVEVDGSAFRQPGESRFSVTTGIDWFDLEGTVDYGPAKAELPQLLQALRSGDGLVQLDDGSLGLVPEDWLRKLGLLATAKTEGGLIRFRRGQAALLDALLATQPAVTVDESFEKIRDGLRSFEGVGEAPQPEGFEGSLRGYQKEGLGWFGFLQQLGLGGCLADDMGVGKTIQVLGLLENRRVLRTNGAGEAEERPGPSLVVAPKSVVFNWLEEAQRFTPKLRVLDYTGPSRSLDEIDDCDLVVTTYGTLRRDAVALKDVSFDYAVLDEAQAIKNARTASAKAARLLNAKHRLALTGTPVENHLGELWSIFEYLNPGMLGASTLWQSSSGALRNPEPEVRDALRSALRPYILRRTKGQVASELPEKLEQTLHCELDSKQRKLYDELRSHYRDSLLGRIESEGLAQSKLHVLEALLRLRQAACHPGLVDGNRGSEPSAKLDALLPMLEETIDGGHKALIFSQFTSFLGLLRPEIEERSWSFEYLDGKTRDRKARVERFQTDPDCRIFLISLKAGGLGLNLTAADYVFLLDPWWNPAVEAQAVDRTHRIGQSRKVFAYRLVARDTVEEKVLELQNSKRELADAIISEDNSLIRDLRAEDLELLLS
jgi:SNF2 family DNA or RNA helicase